MVIYLEILSDSFTRSQIFAESERREPLPGRRGHGERSFLRRGRLTNRVPTDPGGHRRIRRSIYPQKSIQSPNPTNRIPLPARITSLYSRILLDEAYPPRTPTPKNGVSTPAPKTSRSERSCTVPSIRILFNRTRSIGAAHGALTIENIMPRTNNPARVVACFCMDDLT